MSMVSVTFDKATSAVTFERGGVVVGGAVNLAAECEAIPQGYGVGKDGVLYSRFRPGLCTWTLNIDCVPVFVTHDKPERAETDNAVVYTWTEAQP